MKLKKCTKHESWEVQGDRDHAAFKLEKARHVARIFRALNQLRAVV